MNDPKQELADFARRIARENRHAAALERQRETSRGTPIRDVQVHRSTISQPSTPFPKSSSPGRSSRPQDPPAANIALKIHSRTDDSDNLYVGVGPFGNLWDALVSGELTVVEIDGRLVDPSDADDGGWMGIDVGDNLYLECEVTNGDISSASLVIGSSDPLCEFDDYTQTLFRVILARGEMLGSSPVVVPMHEGELVSFFDVIDSKLAKYAR